MLLTLKNTRHGSLSGNDGGSFIAAIKHPSPGSFIMNYNKHGLRHHKLYKSWQNIKERCYNKKSNSYKNYGGRDITVCDEWRNNFKAYFDHVMSLENAMQLGLTLDRIKNNEGYYPGNLRWVDKHIQVVNRRKQKNNTSGYIGVWFHKSSGKWAAGIGMDGKYIHLKYHETPEFAATARNKYIIENDLVEYSTQQINTQNNGKDKITDFS